MRRNLCATLVGLMLLMPAASHADILLQDFEGNGVTPNDIFRTPSWSGSTDMNVANDTTEVSTDQAFSPTHSLKVAFDWTKADASLWDRLTTTGFNPIISATDPLSMMVFNAGVDPLAFALGVRETNPTGDIGTVGSGSGSLEWIGSDGPAGIPNPTHIVAPGAWTQVVFDPQTDPINAFTGNGAIDSTTGKLILENLGIRSQGTTNRVTFYIDDIKVLSRGGTAIPEPGTLALLGTGLLPLLGLRRRRA